MGIQEPHSIVFLPFESLYFGRLLDMIMKNKEFNYAMTFKSNEKG
jgi:hypothetical protein